MSSMIPIPASGTCMRTVVYGFATCVRLHGPVHIPSQTIGVRSSPSNEQLCARRGVKLATRAATAYEVAFTSEQPYYVLPDKRSMLQKITVVKTWQFAGDHDMKEVAGATALILDASGSIHSLFREDTVITGSYWDACSLLPPLIPDGPIGILGLGAGTVARTMHHFWPGVKMEGWDLDGSIYPVAREHMGLQQLEDSGALVCHTGDALADDAVVQGGFAGIVVDLFAEGQILPALCEVDVWKQLAQRLRPGGRIIANISDSSAVAHAIAEVFPGAQGHLPLNEATRNCIALTGPAVGEEVWQSFPKQLAHCTTGWTRLRDMNWD
ncbi:hypothetical protein ABBQ32_007432 [Trebouxia sp. C0010 RCD-2024]